MQSTASKWKIAALTLVTLPLTIWLSPKNPDLPVSKFLYFLGFLPLFIAATMELQREWEAVVHKWRNPESQVKNDQKGNKVFYILCLTLAGLVLLIICVGSMLHT